MVFYVSDQAKKRMFLRSLPEDVVWLDAVHAAIRAGRTPASSVNHGDAVLAAYRTRFVTDEDEKKGN